MNTAIDLAGDPVEYLIRHAGWDDILSAVRGVTQWTNDIARKLDVYFLHHTIRLLRVSTSSATLLDFSAHLARVAHPGRSAALDSLELHYAERWLAWRDLIDARTEAMAAPVGAAVKSRTHLVKALDLLAGNGGTMAQSEIGTQLNLKGPNLTRVMNLLEGAEMIERNKEGREKIVTLTPPGKALVVGSKPGDSKKEAANDSCGSNIFFLSQQTGTHG